MLPVDGCLFLCRGMDIPWYCLRKWKVITMRHPKMVAREAEAIGGAMDISPLKLSDRIVDELPNCGILTIEQSQSVSRETLYRATRDVVTRSIHRVSHVRH